MRGRAALSVILASVVATVAPALAQPTAAPAATAPPAGMPPIPASFSGLSLQVAEQDALARSPDVRAARAVVQQNEAALAAVRSALGPSLATTYTTAPQSGGNGTTLLSRMATVQVQTTVGDLIAASPLAAAALATLRSAQSSETAVERTERLTVVNLYYDALKARAVLSARESALASANAQLHAAQIRFAKGDAPKLDVVRAQVAVAKATADEALARVADTNATEALRIETGVQATAFASTSGDPTPQGRDLDASTAVKRALALRPELSAAAQTAQAAEASARAAHRVIFPALTVGAGYAKGVDAGQSVSAPVVNVGLTIPLNGAARAKASQADAVAAEDQAKADAISRSIEVQVAARARNVVAAEQASAATTQARIAAAAQLAATQVGYASGASSSLELSTARDVYTQALVDDLSAQYDEARARAVLNLEAGG